MKNYDAKGSESPEQSEALRLCVQALYSLTLSVTAHQDYKTGQEGDDWHELVSMAEQAIEAAKQEHAACDLVCKAIDEIKTQRDALLAVAECWVVLSSAIGIEETHAVFQKHGYVSGRKRAWLLQQTDKAIALCDMKAHIIENQLKKWEDSLTAVMPEDCKDWHENSPAEWPEVAAALIVNLRKDRDLAWEITNKIVAKNEELEAQRNATRAALECCQAWISDGKTWEDIEEVAAKHGYKRGKVPLTKWMNGKIDEALNENNLTLND